MPSLYFAKMNINAEIFSVYEDEEDKYLNKVLTDIFNNLANTDYVMKKKSIKKDVELKKEYIRETRFELTTQKVLQAEKIIVADFIRNTPIFANQKNKDGELVPVPVDNYESIRCFLDFKSEIISFFTTNRFGFRQFQKDFERYINELMFCSKSEYKDKIGYEGDINLKVPSYIKIRMITYNASLSNFYEYLQDKGKINNISISIIPPNASRKDILSLDESAKEKIRILKELRATEEVICYNSSVYDGINLESEEFKKILEEAEKINKKISLEQEELKKQEELEGQEEFDGVDELEKQEEYINYQYVIATATNRKGETFTTEDNTLYKLEVDKKVKKSGVDKFIEICKEAITNLIRTIK